MANLGASLNDVGAGVSDLFQASADRSKASYDLMEGQEYTLASDLATQNAQYTQMSTAIKEAGENREITQALGKTQADVAGAGFAESGSALDILRSGAQQGAIVKAATSEQGLINEAGYNEQAASYNLMATAADQAASAEGTAAKGADIAAIIKFAAANWA
ncbi:MAG TPA: hypothetical protein VK749_15920 [Xanthobacteraceae bacterium]|jgi:hypothetical protein|nr:hypothetical protein [Xanthobacteraceae bacterium]